MTARPRILMVVRLYAPWIGGTERQAQALARTLIGMGFDVSVSTGRWFRGTLRTETIDGVPVIRNHTLWEFFGIRGMRKLGGYLYMVTLAFTLWRRRSSYDIIHVHGLNYHTAVSAVVGRRLGKPVLVKLANSGPDSDIVKMRTGQQLAGSGIMLPAALSVDRFVALNPVIVEELVASGVDRRRIVEIPNGVDDTQPVERNQTGRPPFGVVFVGRIHEQKDLPTLVRAVGLVEARRAGSVTVTLVGDGPLREEIETMVASMGLDERISLVGATEDVASHLRAADIFVLPSRAEGLSNALLEAMAAGLAPVVSEIPGNVDVVEHERTGLFFDPGDEESLAAAIVRLVENPEWRHQLGEEARQAAVGHYGLSAVAARYAALYGELAAVNRSMIREESR